jgi:hypothetical protein
MPFNANILTDYAPNSRSGEIDPYVFFTEVLFGILFGDHVHTNWPLLSGES